MGIYLHLYFYLYFLNLLTSIDGQKYFKLWVIIFLHDITAYAEFLIFLMCIIDNFQLS